jgi:hypothetical protein
MFVNPFHRRRHHQRQAHRAEMTDRILHARAAVLGAIHTADRPAVLTELVSAIDSYDAALAIIEPRLGDHPVREAISNRPPSF